MFYRRIMLALFVFQILCYAEIYAGKTIRVLAIGNSFSVDAAEVYLDDLAEAANIKLIVGNCNIGGCSLERHWHNALGDSALYAYHKIVNGDSTLLMNRTLKQCLQDEAWDYITFQQVSHLAGLYDTYFPYITDLGSYVRQFATNRKVKFALHQVWAYANNSTHPGFNNYNRDQSLMYHAISTTVQKAAETTGIDIIIPSRSAIQNGRNTIIGDYFCRDGFHLSTGLGRYTAACVWFEVFTGKSVLRNRFKPVGVSERDAVLARKSAHYAIKEPLKVTIIHP